MPLPHVLREDHQPTNANVPSWLNVRMVSPRSRTKSSTEPSSPNHPRRSTIRCRFWQPGQRASTTPAPRQHKRLNEARRSGSPAAPAASTPSCRASRYPVQRAE
eukprot:scaffold518_cov388-Prasinococcus_capsulatus_cf.AAC.58